VRSRAKLAGPFGLRQRTPSFNKGMPRMVPDGKAWGVSIDIPDLEDPGSRDRRKIRHGGFIPLNLCREEAWLELGPPRLLHSFFRG
jgi:hypothetical protein